MAKAKEKKERRKAERQAMTEAELAARAGRERRARLLRWSAIGVPFITVMLVLGAYFGLEDRQLTGLFGLMGVAIWIPALLGALAAGVDPRDRLAAGSIDFGNRRR